MAGTPNPSANIRFGNGNLQPLPDLADSVLLYIGPSTDGPFNRPRRAAVSSSVLAFRHGPLVGSSSHQVKFSQACYVQRCRASISGTFGSVSKTAFGSSPGTVSVSASSYSLHAPIVSTGQPMNVTSGWAKPPAAMLLTITSGAGTVAHTQTISYTNEDGDGKVTPAISIPGPGTITVPGVYVKQIAKIVSNIDPVGTQSYSANFDGPQDRHDVRFEFVTGGQISGGYSQPTFRYSFDAGRTFSSSRALPVSGIVDLDTYAGGLTPQATGIRLTFASGSNTVTDYGSLRLTGADVNGDVVATAIQTGLTLSTVIAGLNTPLSFGPGPNFVINLATDGAGVATTTAAQFLTFFLTDGSANTIAARQNFRFRTVGTGASLMVAHVSAGFANAGLVMTARQEDVLVNIYEPTASQTRKVDVVGKTLNIRLDTDANGVRTSTALQIEAMINGDPLASQLASFLHTGTGAGLVGDTVGPIALITSFDSQDRFEFSTTPPTPSNADLDEAFAALEARQDVMSNISHVAILKDGADSVDFQSFHSTLDDMGEAKKQFKRGVISAAYMGTQDELTWATNVKNSLPQRGTKIGVVAGEVDTQIPAYGTRSRRNFLTLYVARLMNCPISEFASHVECDTLRGIQYELPGVGDHLIPGGDPDRPEYTSMWQSEDILVDLHSQNMVTPRQHANLPGVYVRQSLNYTNDGDDYTFAPNGRIADIGAALAYRETLRMLVANLLTDSTTGYLAEVEHQKIEKNVKSYVGAKLLSDQGRQHVVEVNVVSDRNVNYSQTHSVSIDLQIVPREPALTFTTSINVVRTIGQ